MHTFHYKQNSNTFMGSLVRDDTLSLDKLSYLCMRVSSRFPMVCFWPYLISADFKPGTAKTLLATFGLIVGNVTLILIYTTILHKVL